MFPFHGCTVAFSNKNGNIHWGAISVLKRGSLPSFHCLNISVPYKLAVEVDVFHTMLCISVCSGLWLDWLFGHLCINIPCSTAQEVLSDVMHTSQADENLSLRGS